MKEPPKRGSLRESLLILLILKKEYVEYAKIRALAQVMVDKDKGVDAFKEFRDTAFPWVETQQKRDTDAHIRLLMDEIKKGGLSVQVTPVASVQSKLKAKQVARDPSSKTRNMRNINSKLGSVIPL